VLIVRIVKCVLVAGTLIVFGGCQLVGPIAIDAGRDRYNSVLQATSKQQAFENIIRVHNYEPTSFMDVTEIDATQTLSGTVSGSLTGIGAKPGTFGTLGSVSPGATYSEAPLIRYVPLTDQGLVEQLVAPVNTDALASLADSEWPLMPLLDFSASFLTLDWGETGVALNLIAELDYNNRLELVSTKSDWTKPKNTSGTEDKTATSSQQTNTKTSTSASTNDALVIYFMSNARARKARSEGKSAPDQLLWDALKGVYWGTQAQGCPSANSGAGKDKKSENAGSKDETPTQAAAKAAAKAAADAADAAKAAADAAAEVAAKAKAAADGSSPSPPGGGSTRPTKVQNCMPGDRNAIELRTMPVTKTPNDFTSAAPVMRTYSALGILRNATQPPNPRIGFVSPEEYWTITQHPWNNFSEDPKLGVYTLHSNDEQPEDKEMTHATPKEKAKGKEKQDREDLIIDRWLEDSPKPIRYVYAYPGISDDDFVEFNERLWQLRRYILIIKSEAPPPADAYVAYFEGGRWYYIDANDTISKKNFSLISLLMTMMAIPPSTPPLNTSIAIGGGG
jgi:hypothetical protein